MSASVSPWFRRLIASRFWWSVSLNGRPIFCPRATARARPSPVRVRIRSRSNSASPPRTVSIRRPCDVVVSAHVSPRDQNATPAVLRQKLGGILLFSSPSHTGVSKGDHTMDRTFSHAGRQLEVRTLSTHGRFLLSVWEGGRQVNQGEIT